MALTQTLETTVWVESRGVTHPLGFKAGATWAGLKKRRPDLAVIIADGLCSAAGVFTLNLVRASSVDYSRSIVQRGHAQAIFCKAGNANACTGDHGEWVTQRCGAITAHQFGIAESEVLVAATGVIGRKVPMEKIEEGLPTLELSEGAESDLDVAKAILTTDTFEKQIAVTLTSRYWEGELKIGGVSKGSGMIAPNMATTLCFLTTDAQIEPEVLQSALSLSMDRSFNRLTVDGDTSTNDMALILASGAGTAKIPALGHAHEAFQRALEQVCMKLARMVAKDGEGATKLVEVVVTGAASEADAAKVGKTIAESPLVKTALFGNDPNWGRIVAAAGRAGVHFDPLAIKLTIGEIEVFKGGQPTEFDLAALSESMKEIEVLLELDLGQGEEEATVWTCDLSYDYVRINAGVHNMITYRSSLTSGSDHPVLPEQRAEILIEALPYLRQFFGQTMVIKYGGSAMIDPVLKEMVAQDVALLQYVGMRPVLVHGGGPEIDFTLKQMNREPVFANGLRVTDEATMDVVEMSLGRTNKSLVSLLNQHGAKAVGLSGKDASLLIAKKMANDGPDLGLVGQIQQVNTELLTNLSDQGYLPVVCSVASGAKGETYNVNADVAAGLIAGALKATKLLMLTDVSGLYENFEDPNSLVSSASASSISKMLDGGRVSKGMIPKLEACLAAVQSGVQAAHLIDGTKPHSLLVELLTDAGVGTMISPEPAWRATANFPLARQEVLA